MTGNPNRESARRKNTAFTVIIAAVVALLLGAGLVAAVLFTSGGKNRWSGGNLSTTSATVSENPSENTSSVVVDDNSEMTSENTSSEDIVLPGTPASAVQLNDRNLVLVNNENELPKDFKPDLTTVDGIKLDKAAAKAFKEMRAAADKKDINLWLAYGYRSPAAQDEIFDWNVEQYMDKGLSKKEATAKAEKTIQRGKNSEYTTGLSIGVNQINKSFANTDEYKWLVNNAYKYGFIMRFPSDKTASTGISAQPWRLRYVGKEAAKVIHDENLSLEEYINKLQNEE